MSFWSKAFRFTAIFLVLFTAVEIFACDAVPSSTCHISNPISHHQNDQQVSGGDNCLCCCAHVVVSPVAVFLPSTGIVATAPDEQVQSPTLFLARNRTPSPAFLDSREHLFSILGELFMSGRRVFSQCALLIAAHLLAAQQVSPPAVDLRAWLAVRGPVRAPELCVNAAGSPMTRAGFEYILEKHVKTAALKLPELRGRSVSPHQLGHSCAVVLLQATRDVRKVALWLGHSDMRTTEIYLRVDPSEKLEGGGPSAQPTSWTVQNSRRAYSIPPRDEVVPCRLSAPGWPSQTFEGVILAPPISGVTTVTLQLDRWTFFGAIRTEYAAIARLRSNQAPTLHAFVKEPARVQRHGFRGFVAAMRARQNRLKDNLRGHHF